MVQSIAYQVSGARQPLVSKVLAYPLLSDILTDLAWAKSDEGWQTDGNGRRVFPDFDTEGSERMVRNIRVGRRPWEHLDLSYSGTIPGTAFAPDWAQYGPSVLGDMIDEEEYDQPDNILAKHPNQMPVYERYEIQYDASREDNEDRRLEYLSHTAANGDEMFRPVKIYVPGITEKHLGVAPPGQPGAQLRVRDLQGEDDTWSALLSARYKLPRVGEVFIGWSRSGYELWEPLILDDYTGPVDSVPYEVWRKRHNDVLANASFRNEIAYADLLLTREERRALRQKWVAWKKEGEEMLRKFRVQSLEASDGENEQRARQVKGKGKEKESNTNTGEEASAQQNGAAEERVRVLRSHTRARNDDGGPSSGPSDGSSSRGQDQGKG